MGAVKNLPEEAQWSIRALLSRGLTSAAAAGPAPQLSFPGLPQVLLQLMSNMNTTKVRCTPALGTLDLATKGACRLKAPVNLKGN